MYFQHYTGQIRSAQLDSDGNWKGGDATEIVAVDAKNGTPIAAVAYARDNIAVVQPCRRSTEAVIMTDCPVVAHLLSQH